MSNNIVIIFLDHEGQRQKSGSYGCGTYHSPQMKLEKWHPFFYCRFAKNSIHEYACLRPKKKLAIDDILAKNTNGLGQTRTAPMSLLPRIFLILEIWPQLCYLIQEYAWFRLNIAPIFEKLARNPNDRDRGRSKDFLTFFMKMTDQ